MKSLDLVDEELLNYDLLEALLAYIVDTEARYGSGALLQASTTQHPPANISSLLPEA